MKKLYSIASIFSFVLLAFVGSGYAQYTATVSGNWSSNLTWAPGAKPSAACNNCTITINPNLTVTLDAAVNLTGTSKLIIGANSKLVIPNSGTNQASPHNSITLALPNGGANGPTIQLVSNTSTINATAAGTYDGVFEGNLLFGLVTVKIVGNSPSVFLAGFAIPGTPGTVNGPALSGPITLNANGTLPVILSSFTASMNDAGGVTVAWTSQIEISSSHYEIQHSTDGVKYESIASVPSHGNSSTPIDYSYTDSKPSSGYITIV